MQEPSSDESVPVAEMLMSNPRRGPIEAPDFGQPTRPIGEFTLLPDFPFCTLGQHVVIGGSVGVVVEIVKQSIKLRTAERTNQSFNSNRLIALYGPQPEMVVTLRTAEEPKALPRAVTEPTPVVVIKRDPPTPVVVIKRDILEEPDFAGPARPIAELISQPDFPKCAYGAHVEIGGYAGVVVEIVKRQSLRVRCQEGTSRTFNADSLRKIYG